MMGIVQTGTIEGRGRAGVMLPVPGYSLYQTRLLQHNVFQVTIPLQFFVSSMKTNTPNFFCG